jgi:hypothetical protein
MDSCPMENFIRIDIADSSHFVLIQQKGFHPTL